MTCAPYYAAGLFTPLVLLLVAFAVLVGMIGWRLGRFK